MRTELHFHLLPGVDDGPRDDGEAIELARLAAVDGTRRIVATPHAGMVDISELPARTERLRAVLAQAGIGLELRVGAELSPNDVPRLTGDQLDAVAQGPSGRRWLLLEAPLEPSQSALAPAAAELGARGFGLLIAHPERSPATGAADVRELVEAGAALQLNASSLCDVHGAEARRSALWFARSGLPFVLASDAHSPERPPLMSKAAGVLLAAGCSPGAVRDAVDRGPERLLVEGLPGREGLPARERLG